MRARAVLQNRVGGKACARQNPAPPSPGRSSGPAAGGLQRRYGGSSGSGGGSTAPDFTIDLSDKNLTVRQFGIAYTDLTLTPSTASAAL